MPSNHDPPGARGDNRRVIHSQRHKGSAADGRQSGNVQSVGAPLKMGRPELSSWVEKRRALTG